jgi:predicted nucleic acid-binding protein
MKILADSSVWVDHLRHGNAEMAVLLEKNVVGIHEFVIGELACGNLPHRERFLEDLGKLPRTPPVSHVEALALSGMHKLSGHGIGWVDIHLLASALVTGTSLWTLDKALGKIAAKLRVAF